MALIFALCVYEISSTCYAESGCPVTTQSSLQSTYPDCSQIGNILEKGKTCSHRVKAAETCNPVGFGSSSGEEPSPSLITSSGVMPVERIRRHAGEDGSFT